MFDDDDDDDSLLRFDDDDDDDDDDSLLRVYVTRTLKQLWATMVTGLLGACTPSGSALCKHLVALTNPTSVIAICTHFLSASPVTRSVPYTSTCVLPPRRPQTTSGVAQEKKP